MMKNWMLCLAFLSSTVTSLACSWWPSGDEIRFQLFSSHLAGSPDAYPLYYSTHFFNDYMVDEYRGPVENIEEWYQYFDGKFSRASIDELLYKFDMDTKKEEASQNELMQFFAEGGNKEAAAYILFAKQVEEQLKEDSWSNKEMDITGLKRSIAIAESRLTELKDESLKMRYAYQLVVINYYLNDLPRVQYYYNNLISRASNQSVLKSWSKFFYAMTLDDYQQQLFLLAEVFDESKSKSEFIYKYFPSNKSQVQGALDMCQTREEEAVILSLLAFKNPGRTRDEIAQIAKLDPNSELLDILLIREINKMEDWYLTKKHTSYGPGITSSCWDCDRFDFIEEKNFQSDKAYLKEMKQLTADILEKGKITNRGLWFTSLAYMSYMLDEQAETDKYLKLANSHAKDKAIQGQLAVVEVLHLMKYEDKWDKKFQEQLMRSFDKVDQFKDELYDYGRFKSQIMLAISNKYMEQGELTIAALFSSKIKDNVIHAHGWGYGPNSGYQTFDVLNENATAEEMDAFFEFWNKPKKTELEAWLLEDVEKYKWRLTDLWATAYFREDKLDEALKIYETIPDSVWQVDNWDLHYYYGEELDNDPFETNMVGRGYGGNESGKTYTKPEFVAELIRLKKLVNTQEDKKAYHAMLLGNAYYNMSYHGNSYYYTEYGWSSYEADDYNRDQSYYYSAERAKKYYEMAEAAAPNDAFAAFCHRLKLKCQFEEIWYQSKNLDNDTDMMREEYWRIFADKYPKHVRKLMNCDHFGYYHTAWQEG